jgi:hypothetical protein
MRLPAIVVSLMLCVCVLARLCASLCIRFHTRVQDQNVAMCRKWHMLNDDKLLPEVDEEMEELLGMSA